MGEGKRKSKPLQVVSCLIYQGFNLPPTTHIGGFGEVKLVKSLLKDSDYCHTVSHFYL